MTRRGRTLWGFLALAVSAPAAADPMLTPITDRNFSIDLYDGVPLGNVAVIATGGATAANALGSSGTLVNPSAPAVRATTDTDRWNWDYHADLLIGSLSGDYANSHIDYAALGYPAPDSKSQAVTFGASLRIGDWAIAETTSLRSTRIVNARAMLPDGSNASVYAGTYRLKFALAKWFDSIDTAIGAAESTAIFDVKPDCDGCGQLFSITGAGAEVGAQWIPKMQDFRIGAAYATTINGTTVTVDNCPNPADCDGFILPDHVVAPQRLTLGGAYRFGPTRWNQLLHSRFRDEEAVTALLDVVVTGSSPNAYGLDAFGIRMLERSGVHTSVSVRAGAEYEAEPGRLRLRAGSYWEPGRFNGVSGRLHGTFGVEIRVLQFWLFGTRRGRITLTGDVASGYKNLGLSIGFWH